MRETPFRFQTPDSLRREASQAAGAAPTLRYGPAGDSAPRLRLKASGMAERFLSARPHGPKQPDNQDHPPSFPRKQRLPPDRPAAVQGAKRRSVPLTARTDPGSSRARGTRSRVRSLSASVKAVTACSRRSVPLSQDRKGVVEIVLRHGPVEGHPLAGNLLERLGEGGHGLLKALCPALPLA